LVKELYRAENVKCVGIWHVTSEFCTR